MLSVAVADCFKFSVKLSNFKGNSDIERYQMANKKIPFKYTRPVEDWLQEKGKNLYLTLRMFLFLFFYSSVIPLACSPPTSENEKPLNPLKTDKTKHCLTLWVLSSAFLSVLYFPVSVIVIFFSFGWLMCPVKGTGKDLKCLDPFC